MKRSIGFVLEKMKLPPELKNQLKEECLFLTIRLHIRTGLFDQRAFTNELNQSQTDLKERCKRRKI